MNYNLRPKPKLIDPMLLTRLNKVYITKHNGNHWILDWLYNTIYPYFKDNFLFSIIVIGLIGYLLYRYFENMKKKNKIIQNINDDAPIEVKLNKPINYDDNPKKESFEDEGQQNNQNNQQTQNNQNIQNNQNGQNNQNNQSSQNKGNQNNQSSNKNKLTRKEESDQLSDLSNLSNLSEMSGISNANMTDSPNPGEFEKDIERNLQMGNNNSKKLNKMPPELIRQAILQEQKQNQQQNQFGQQQQQFNQKPEIYAHNLMTPNMPMSILEQNMNQLKNMGQQTCSNFKTPSLYEPTALNAFSDNFMNFEEM
jgi:hypothetical protein